MKCAMAAVSPACSKVGVLCFQLYWDIFFQHPNRLDSALMLIILMAFNVERIQFTTTASSAFALLRRALCLTWSNASTTCPSTPFQELSNLCIGAKRSSSDISDSLKIRVPILKTICTLRLVQRHIEELQIMTQSSTTLKTLEIVDAYVTPATLISDFATGMFIGLRHMSIIRVESTPQHNSPWTLRGLLDSGGLARLTFV